MSNVENVSPQVLRSVSREVARLVAAPPAGVKLQLSDADLTDIVAHIEGPADTPYWGGVFRVRLSLGGGFPATPPRATFLTKIFHPNVHPRAGDVCVNTLKRDWKPELGLAHALLAIRCLLIAPNPESALNAEAAALLLDRYDDYFARAKMYTEIHAAPAAAAAAASRDGADADQTTHTQEQSSAGGPSAKRRAAPPAPPAAPAAAAAARAARDKRRILKRL